MLPLSKRPVRLYCFLPLRYHASINRPTWKLHETGSVLYKACLLVLRLHQTISLLSIGHLHSVISFYRLFCVLVFLRGAETKSK